MTTPATASTTTPTTPPHEVTFPRSWLAAIRLFAAKKDVRYYLNAVAITRGGMVATDGHYLGVIRDARFDDLPEIILFDTDVDAFLKAAKTCRTDPDVTLRWTRRHPEEPAHGTLMMGGVTHAFISAAARYPDWTRVLIPRPRRPDAALQFNWTSLALFEKVATVLVGGNSAVTRARFQPCGRTNGARITIPAMSAFEGVLMGLCKTTLPYED